MRISRSTVCWAIAGTDAADSKKIRAMRVRNETYQVLFPDDVHALRGWKRTRSGLAIFHRNACVVIKPIRLPVSGSYDADTQRLTEIVWELNGDPKTLPDLDLEVFEGALEASYTAVTEQK